MMSILRIGLCAVLVATAGRAASLDFAVSANLPGGIPIFAADRDGNILIASRLGSYTCPLPVVNAMNTCGPLWIAKLDPTGQHIVFATYFGVSYGDLAGIGADAKGNIIIAADTQDPNWPTVNALQPTLNGTSSNLYIAKFSPDGSQLIYATYLGGSGYDIAQSLTVDDAGAAYVKGYTSSKDFPTTPQSLPSGNGPGGIMVKLSPDGKTLDYASFLPAALLSTPTLGRCQRHCGLTMLASPLDVPDEVWKLAPDGSQLDRIPVSPSTNVTTYLSGAFSLASGGFILTSTTSGYFPLPGGPGPYVRVENGQPENTAIPAQHLNGLVVVPQNRNRVYAATDGGLLLSEDNGLTWSQLYTGSSQAIAIDPFDSNHLYLGASGTYVSTDGGQSWTQTNSAFATAFSSDANTPGLVYALAGGVYRSADGGATWTLVWSNPYPFQMPSFSFAIATSVLADPGHAGQAYIFGYTGCNMGCPPAYWVLQSTDQGATWNAAPVLGQSGGFDPTTGDLYLVSGGKVSVIRGDVLSNAPVALNLPAVNSLVFDPDSGRVYAELTDFSVLASDDHGVTWTPVVQLNSGLLAAVGANGVLHVNDTSNTEHAFTFLLGGDGSIQSADYLSTGYPTQLESSGEAGGKVFVAGSASGQVPVVDAVQPTFGGGSTDGFLTVFNADGTIAWSTFLGGSGYDTISQVLPLRDGSAIVVGMTGSHDFPMLQPSPLGPGGIFIARLRP
jgi:hypothetical protein